MNQINISPLKILRLKEVLARSGDSRSGIYKKIADGLFVKPVRIGARSVGVPEHEVQAIIAARISGKTNEELRSLVASLDADRGTLSDIHFKLNGGR